MTIINITVTTYLRATQANDNWLNIYKQRDVEIEACLDEDSPRDQPCAQLSYIVLMFWIPFGDDPL